MLVQCVKRCLSGNLDLHHQYIWYIQAREVSFHRSTVLHSLTYRYIKMAESKVVKFKMAAMNELEFA